ncbi:MAG TPA: O-antigen ligase family protein, partial [Puia sp.]|nr:O-antigen ligase family protein [Puia sp.]
RRRKRWVLFALIISVLAMTYSGTRTATLMLIVEIGLYVLMTFTERRTIIFFSVFAFVLLAVIFGPSYGNGTLRRLKSTFDFKSEESLQVRDINRHGIQPYIYSHPIGGGVGTTGVAYIDYNKGHPLAGFPTDSGLLSIVLEYGWIGLIINCLTYFIILQQGVLTYFKTNDPDRKIMLLTAVLFIFGFVFAQYAQVAIGQIPNSFIFFALNAIIIRLRQMELNKPITEH